MIKLIVFEEKAKYRGKGGGGEEERSNKEYDSFFFSFSTSFARFEAPLCPENLKAMHPFR